MRIVKQFSLIQLMGLTALIMGSLMVFLGYKLITASIQKNQQATQDTQLIVLIDALEKVAHHHAIERGLTAGFLGNPTSENQQKVRAQRERADNAIVHLQNVVARPDLAGFSTSQGLLRKQLEIKPSVRQQVDNQNGAGVFAFYSTLNQLALDNALSLTFNVKNKDAGNQLAIALKLAELKERTGQLRGKINGALASQQVSDTALAEIAGFNNRKQMLSAQIASQLTGPELVAFNTAMGSDAAMMVNAIAAEFDSNIDFATLPDSQTWFAAATQLIGQVKKIVDLQWDSISTDASQVKKESSIAMWWLSGSMLLIVLITLLMFWVMVNQLKSQMNLLTFGLEQISDRGDLTYNVQLNSKSELGQVSQAVNKTIMGLRILTSGLKASIQASSHLSGKLNSASIELVDDSQSTEQKSIAIASAVEEMAVTSNEITQAAVRTLEAARSLDGMADSAQMANNQIRQTMQALLSDMQSVQQSAAAMETQVSQISHILEEINTLSDQTNLLALNAAIEAARAGEHGRGFAVVADEVRKLAMGSRESTDRISALLASLQEASNVVVNDVNKNTEAATTALSITESGESTASEVKKGAASVEEMANSMSAAAEQQSLTVAQIAQDIIEVQQAATQELSIANSLRGLAQEMSTNNQVMSDTMCNFKLD
ncbi:methyl-accepting chemotaxis protein [Salinimonas lutimaris]|uniref:methyl-accepting chemotaxis protein n=1 Tax=Salinimonas lutimaris TaxID=914153 RepID=UPI0010C0F70A|nr:methyl-accepting chemotaxis protein [Salinimonas lutimaris]